MLKTKISKHFKLDTVSVLLLLKQTSTYTTLYGIIVSKILVETLLMEQELYLKVLVSSKSVIHTEELNWKLNGLQSKILLSRVWLHLVIGFIQMI